MNSMRSSGSSYGAAYKKFTFFAFLEKRIMDSGTTENNVNKKEHKYHLNFKSWFSRALIILFCDVLSTFFAFFMALYIRYDFKFKDIDPMYLEWMLYLVPLWCLFTFVVFYGMRLYHSIWTYFSLEEAIRVIESYLILAPLFVLSSWILHMRMPVTFYVFGTLSAMALHVFIRFSYRILRRFLKRTESIRKLDGKNTHNVMIIGGGNSGSVLIKELKNYPDANQVPVCIIDDNPAKWGRSLYGVPIVGGKDDIIQKAAEYDVDTIIYAIPSVSGVIRKEYLDIAKETGCKLRTIPGIDQLANGQVSVSQIKEVELVDLLGREPITVDNGEVFDMIKGKTILVTGGGGSIGSELCRQIASHDPKQLIIFDIYENNAYEIQQELLRKYKDSLNLVTLIGSVRNTHRINTVMQKYKPDIVFHAAAHKHVPLMEDSPNEAIKNNVMGTYKTAKAAAETGVKKFVLISTDKAVNPTNIMGATKRICEMVVQMMERQYPDTTFVAVRFGNVLGSNGSVIPLFKKQIAEGGPLTVTHKDITRFFMTIPEAVSLVLQASYYAWGGEIFVLDMGEPVRIDDMARNLIKLSGLRPDVDIKIEYTGLRPGEKLYEEKLMAEEGMKTTKNKLIFIGKPIEMDDEEFKKKLGMLDDDSQEDDENIREYVKAIVPTYHPTRVE
jgi:FlaA1/EpsC-like NDP-sugar epimerase